MCFQEPRIPEWNTRIYPFRFARSILKAELTKTGMAKFPWTSRLEFSTPTTCFALVANPFGPALPQTTRFGIERAMTLIRRNDNLKSEGDYHSYGNLYKS